MVKKAALKTAGISMDGFQARKKVFDGQTPEPAMAAAEAVREPGRPFTGVGSVMAAITREAEISQELTGAQAKLQQANTRLAEFEGAELVKALDPRSIRRSQWANRAEAEFQTPEFLQLKDEIASAGGNVQPIKVRSLDGAPAVFDGQTPTHEIVFGHRRHQACLELGLPVQAIVVERMDDKSLFEAMDRENRGRKNLSPWEQGRMYEQAIKQGLYPSLRRLSESLAVNLSDAACQAAQGSGRGVPVTAGPAGPVGEAPGRCASTGPGRCVGARPCLRGAGCTQAIGGGLRPAAGSGGHVFRAGDGHCRGAEASGGPAARTQRQGHDRARSRCAGGRPAALAGQVAEAIPAGERTGETALMRLSQGALSGSEGRLHRPVLARLLSAHVDRGGGQALMAQVGLQNILRDAARRSVRTIGVPQPMCRCLPDPFGRTRVARPDSR
jgi:ParB/RepB/Spo0J family partition protein